MVFSLESGILVKLIDQIGVNENEASEDPKPVLLQIRSIIPVMADDDLLWPNKGFYLKVSDSSHAAFVSLPHEHDDWILRNELQIGQFIYVQKIKSSYPLPIIRGLDLVPGVHPLIGSPKDIVVKTKLPNFEDQSADNDDRKKVSRHGNYRSVSASKTRPRGSNLLPRKSDAGPGFVDKDVDLNSTRSSTCSASMQKIKRRSWNGAEIARVKEVSDSPLVKDRPLCRAHSAGVSRVPSITYEISDGNLVSSVGRQRLDVSPSTKSTKSSIKFKNRTSENKGGEPQRPSMVPTKDTILTKTSISWNAIPPNLEKLGKDVYRHRDMALAVAVEALQEACVAERLIKCLRCIFSELQSSNMDHLQISIDKFLILQDNLTHTRLIIQSLQHITSLQSSDADTTSLYSINEVLKLASERKKNAASWIQAAMESDLSPISSSSTTSKTANTRKKSISLSVSTKSKSASIVGNQRKIGDHQRGLETEGKNADENVKVSASFASDLAKRMQVECRRWFLDYIEKFLDGVKEKTICMESHRQVAEMMHQIKRISDWLDTYVSCKDHVEENNVLDEIEVEACGRVRNKIFEVLLSNVERSAIALESMDSTTH
ncbi:Protein of unknown function DUF936, plant [Dillenia turbinata]|uniref:Uncharacterized protein n=1 Tax=Dillenia turbinata TaxID=194707 RepID=A0AAN8WHA1_9MAGN